MSRTPRLASLGVFHLPCDTVQYTVTGGLERVVFDICVGLSSRGHKVAVACPDESQLPKGVRHIKTGKASYKVHQDWLLAEERAFEKYQSYIEDFDVCHGHDWFAHELLWRRDHPESNVKICHSHHGGCNWRTVPVKCPNLIGISNDHALSISLKLGVPVRVAYNPVAVEEYPFVQEKEDYYLFLSRVTAIKGAHVAIDLARRCRVKLLVAGGDTFVDDPTYVQRVVRLCDGMLVKYIGEVSYEKKKELLSKAKALIFPPQNFREPFGLVVLEALSCGTPVIALKSGALSETVKNKEVGFVCDTIQEMEEVIKEGKVDGINPKKCRKWAENFNRDRCVKRYLEIYKDLIEGFEW